MRLRVVKRKRSMNSDTAATASATSFQHRPILHPTPPSTRQRSPSPTRKVLSQLKLATPSLRVCQPDVRLEQPPAVRRLRRMLIMRLSSEVIPHGLEVAMYSFNSRPGRRFRSIRSVLPSLRRPYGRPPSFIQ